MQEPADRVTVTQKRYQCRHIHAAGHQCGSPALRREQFCYFHHTTRRPKPPANGFRYINSQEPFTLPIVEDRVSAISVAAQVLSRIATNDLDPTRAGAMLYNLQILASLLPREPRAAASPLGSIPEPTPPPTLVAELVDDETHGPIAPITELPPEPTPPAVILSEKPSPTADVVILSEAPHTPQPSSPQSPTTTHPQTASPAPARPAVPATPRPQATPPPRLPGWRIPRAPRDGRSPNPSAARETPASPSPQSSCPAPVPLPGLRLFL
jgi:hypothetical protein